MIGDIHLDCDALHDQVERKHDALALVVTQHNALHPSQRAAANSRLFANPEKRVRHGMTQVQAAAQGFNLDTRQRRRSLARADKREHSGNAQHLPPFLPGDLHKNVAGKQRAPASDGAAVGPSPKRGVKRQKVLDLAHREMLSHLLLVARSGIGGIPAAILFCLPSPRRR
jgi:hypothetical protein